MSDERAGHKLGEVLRSAREARGVDLARVERDTKIRVRYLTALENGDYRDLPGAVYTKGFLRNYGGYLGLDAEYLIDLYRLESAGAGMERVSVQPPPRPITAKRARAFVLTPGAVVATILTIGVVIFAFYFIREFVTFAGTPELTISDPAGDLASYAGETYRFRGTTEPNSTIRVEGAVENPTVTAADDGSFEVLIRLVPGSNVITLVASDPVTGRDSASVSRTIVVGNATPSPTQPGGVTVVAPTNGASQSGPVEVSGTAAPGSTVVVSVTLVEAAKPSFRVVTPIDEAVPIPDSTPIPPDPQEVEAASDGAFTASLRLAPGAWEITVAPEQGDAVTLEVMITTQPGLRATLRVRGGVSYLEIDEDGKPLKDVSGRTAERGTTLRLGADASLRIRAGNAGVVTLVVNGIDLGKMGGSGAVVEWRITRR